MSLALTSFFISFFWIWSHDCSDFPLLYYCYFQHALMLLSTNFCCQRNITRANFMFKFICKNIRKTCSAFIITWNRYCKCVFKLCQTFKMELFAKIVNDFQLSSLLFEKVLNTPGSLDSIYLKHNYIKQ